MTKKEIVRQSIFKAITFKEKEVDEIRKSRKYSEFDEIVKLWNSLMQFLHGDVYNVVLSKTGGYVKKTGGAFVEHKDIVGQEIKNTKTCFISMMYPSIMLKLMKSGEMDIKGSDEFQQLFGILLELRKDLHITEDRQSSYGYVIRFLTNGAFGVMQHRDAFIKCSTMQKVVDVGKHITEEIFNCDNHVIYADTDEFIYIDEKGVYEKIATVAKSHQLTMKPDLDDHTFTSKVMGKKKYHLMDKNGEMVRTKGIRR